MGLYWGRSTYEDGIVSIHGEDEVARHEDEGWEGQCKFIEGQRVSVYVDWGAICSTNVHHSQDNGDEQCGHQLVELVGRCSYEGQEGSVDQGPELLEEGSLFPYLLDALPCKGGGILL